MGATIIIRYTISMTSETRAWVLPEEPVPVRSMNTIWADAAGLHDDWGSEGTLRDWIAEVTNRDPSAIGDPSASELAEALYLRDALRRLAAFCTDDPRHHAQSPVDNTDDAVAAVNAVPQRPPAQLAIRDGRLHRDQPHGGTAVSAALADLAHDAVEFLTGPEASKLRACQAPGCVLYFTKSHPRREWCSEACGNRARAARHYQRVRTRKS